MSRQQWDVFGPLAKRHHFDWKYIQTIIEIFAKPTGANLGAEIPIGGRYDANVNVFRLLVAHPLVLFFLKHTQELALQVQRYLADLVEEQGTPIRCLETAQSILERACKRPLHVTEKLALIEFLWNGGAVHSNQRFIRTPASLVNFLRNQFLTRACFSKDHYRRI